MERGGGEDVAAQTRKKEEERNSKGKREQLIKRSLWLVKFGEKENPENFSGVVFKGTVKAKQQKRDPERNVRRIAA